jgi:hypothetical protein
MYEDIDGLVSPNNDDIIWRYMDFTKFVSLLDRRALFFSVADKLTDKFEGSFSRPTAVLRLLPPPENVFKGIDITTEVARKIIAINSWHINEYESAAMWNLYTKGDDGIAIQSRFHRLKYSFNDAQEKVYIGKIKYIDYKTDYMPDGKVLYPFLHKRKSFEHEKELRAVIIRYREDEDGHVDQSVFEYGDYIPVNLGTLIENVHVSPTSQEWFKNLVQSMMTKYGFNIEVKKSGLSDAPY